MSLVTKTLNGMHNGVSQRPAPLRQDNRFERQKNFMSDVIDGVVKRPNTEFVAALSSNATENAYIHTINKSLDEQYKVIFTGDSDEPIEIYDIEGNSYDVSFDNQATKDYITTEDPKKYNRCLTLSDKTLILNTTEEVKSKEDYGGIDPQDFNKHCMAWIKEGLPEISYTLTVYDKDGEKITSTTVESPASENDQIATTPTDEVAQEIVDNIDSELDSDYEIFSRSSVIFFKYTGLDSWDEVDIKVETEDGFGDTAFIAINGTVDDQTELPSDGIERYPIAVTGGRSEDEGAYYVEWDADEEVYLETRTFYDFDGNNLPNFLDEETMPRVMEKQDDDTFLIKEGEWKENLVGDEESSPMPSFVGNTIKDVFFYRNRVGFLSGNNVIFSKADDYFNLFPKTAVAVLSQDPIDVSVVTRKDVTLRHAVAFAKSLVLFSEEVQFIVGSSGRTLTPESITIDPSTYFETEKYCEPVGAGPHIYFGVPKGNYSGIREYYVKTDTLITDAEDVTAHVSKYIPSELDKLVSTSAYDMLFALSRKEQDTLYVYSYKWSGEERAQSSWSRWVFKGEKILDIAINENWLFMITEQDGNINLLRMDLRMITEDNLNIKVFLDRKVHLTGDYDSSEDYTYFDLPYEDIEDRFWAVDDETGLKLNGLEKVDNSTIKILGDHSDKGVFIGKPFESLLEYSPFYIKNEGGLPDVQGKLQLKTLSLSFTKTGEFLLRVTPYPRDNIRPYVEGDEELEEYLSSDVIEQEYSGIVLGEAVLDTPPVITGEHTFPVTANAKKVRLELVADTHLPASFQLTAFEAEYSNRAMHR